MKRSLIHTGSLGAGREQGYCRSWQPQAKDRTLDRSRSRPRIHFIVVAVASGGGLLPDPKQPDPSRWRSEWAVRQSADTGHCPIRCEAGLAGTSGNGHIAPGFITVPPSPSRTILFFRAGSGLSPARSMGQSQAVPDVEMLGCRPWLPDQTWNFQVRPDKSLDIGPQVLRSLQRLTSFKSGTSLLSSSFFTSPVSPHHLRREK